MTAATDPLALMNAALDRDDIAAAATAASAALAAGVHDPLVYNLSAWKLEQDDAFADAEALLDRGIARWPHDAALHLGRGVALRSQGRMREAIAAFERAIEHDPRYAAAWYERGATFEKGGALADAMDDFRHVLALEPDNPAAHGSIAAACVRRGELDEAEQHARQALAREGENIPARNALAQIATQRGDPDEAVRVLAPILEGGPLRREALINSCTILGDAHEAAGRYDDAYAAYQQAQDLFRTIHGARTESEEPTSFAFLETVQAGLDAVDSSLWDAPGATGSAPVERHVFLTGYPRSGTTLTENILASLPGTVAVEERPTLAHVDRSFLGRPGGLAELAGADEATLSGLRAEYWNRATRAATGPIADKTFVDMDPFKGPRLPAIARLFPAAKVIVMRRDPRDVVWSCFHTSFAYNAGTMAFTSLESTARHYSQACRIVQDSLDRLPIDAFELSYESLVRDFDATTQALCRFLDVPWDDNVRRFDRTAKLRGVSTASASQVHRGLYDGSGGWRRYAAQLATVEPILRPWIERFGYPAD